MTVEILMDAIDNIDDSYIEEVAYGRKRLMKAPWGMIASAACLCLVIVAAIFLHNAGWMPYFGGPSDATNPPVITDPSGTAIPSHTTRPEADSAELEIIRNLFLNESSWYRRTLVDEYASPKELHLRYFFYNNTEFGKGLQPTKEEMDELMAWDDYDPQSTLVCLPVSKMDEVLTEYFGITVAQMENASFAGLKYVQSIDAWCFWGIGTLDVVKISIQDVVKEVGDIFRMVYTAGEETYEVMMKPNGVGYHVLSNMKVSLETQPDPTDPTGTTAPTTPPEFERYNAMFGDYNSWYNRALVCEYTCPEELSLVKFFYRGFADEPQQPTDAEWAQLKDQPGFEENFDLFRLPVDKMNAVLTEYFGITLDDVNPEGFENLVYLESTNCYYFMTTGALIAENFAALSVEELDDGTICVEYQCAYPSNTTFEVTLKPNGGGYQILSNVVKDPS